MKCIYQKTNGKQCSADAISDSEYCFWHDPDTSPEKRKEASAEGGRGSRIKVKEPLEPVEINDTGDVVSLLADSINMVRSGSMDIKIANCLGYLASTVIKALEISEVEKRLETVEKHLAERETY